MLRWQQENDVVGNSSILDANKNMRKVFYERLTSWLGTLVMKPDI